MSEDNNQVDRHRDDRYRLNNKLTIKVRKRFLEQLYANGGNITRTLDDLNITRTAYYTYLKKTTDTVKQFNKQIDETIEQASQVLISEANRRAYHGVDEPVFYKGEVVGHVKKYSDSLLMFLIKGYDKRFVDRREVSGPDGGPIPAHVVASKMDLSRLSTEELKQLKALSRKLLTEPEQASAVNDA